MTTNIIDYGYMMNVVDDNVVKYEIEYIEHSPEIKHYEVTFNETKTTSPTTYTAPDGTVYNWDNDLISLTEVDTEV